MNLVLFHLLSGPKQIILFLNLDKSISQGVTVQDVVLILSYLMLFELPKHFLLPTQMLVQCGFLQISLKSTQIFLHIFLEFMLFKVDYFINKAISTVTDFLQYLSKVIPHWILIQIVAMLMTIPFGSLQIHIIVSQEILISHSLITYLQVNKFCLFIKQYHYV